MYLIKQNKLIYQIISNNFFINVDKITNFLLFNKEKKIKDN